MCIVIIVHFLTLIESWVNNWCAEEGIPALLDKDALLRTQLITSDDDPLLHGAFQSVMQRHESPYGIDAKDRSCKWHKVSCKFLLFY